MDHFPPRQILVPFDFSESSRAGLRFAKQLGWKWGARLEIVHVADPLQPALTENALSAAVQQALGSYYRALEGRLREQAADYRDCVVRLLEGGPKGTLARRAAEGADDLIVMGTRGRGGLLHFLLGSVAEAVVRAAKVPVLTVHADSRWAPSGRILAPVNFTDYSDHALLYASELAKALGTGLTVLHVVEPDHASCVAAGMLERHVRRLLSAHRDGAVETILERGDAAERILATADAMGFDFIALASQRKPFRKGLRLGTTAERVLRYSRFPVLSVPAPKAEAESEAERLERLMIESLPR